MEFNDNTCRQSEELSGNENAFRVPLVPRKKKETIRDPLKSRNTGEGQSKLSFSPGTSATEGKKAAMLEKLQKRRTSNLNKWEQKKGEKVTKTKHIHLGKTERSFIGQAIPQPPRPSFSNLSVINPSESFVMTTPVKGQTGPLCSTPFPTKKNAATKMVNETVTVTIANKSIYDSHEDITDRQFKALAVWCNMLLSTCNRFEGGVEDLGKTKQEASKRLQDLLSKPGKDILSEEKKFKYKDFLRQQEFDIIRSRAYQAYSTDDFSNKIVALIQNGHVTIRDGFNVYSDLILKTNLLRVFLSFHPVWLHLGMEVVFGRTIPIPDGASFLSVMSRFINGHLFTDEEIMKKKKYAVGTVKMLVTPEGREALHRHFLIKTCQFLYCVETCKTAGIISSDPRLFARKSPFKSLNDIFSEFSREILSASSLSLVKGFFRIGFQPKYKQSFFDDLEYKVETVSDLTDGVNLGKLVEVACSLRRSTVMSKLRNPGGDRLRKINNVTVVLDSAARAGVDLGKIKPEVIVAGHKETILEVLWRIIGIFVLASNKNSEELRRESLRLQIDRNGRLLAEKHTSPEDYVLQICQNLGFTFGMMINSLNDLKDGVLLSMIWREYNSGAVDIHFYQGKELFQKVVNAAETELDVPVGLHGSLPLFIHMFLTRVFHIRRLNVAATKIQKAWRDSRLLKKLKKFLSSHEGVASCMAQSSGSRNQDTYTLGADESTTVEEKTYVVEKRLLTENEQTLSEDKTLQEKGSETDPEEQTLTLDHLSLNNTPVLDSIQESQNNTVKDVSTSQEEFEFVNDTFQETQMTFLDSYSQVVAHESCSSLVENFKRCGLIENEDVAKKEEKDRVKEERFEVSTENVDGMETVSASFAQPIKEELVSLQGIEDSFFEKNHNVSLDESIQRALDEIDQIKSREHAALIIQRFWRGYVTRMNFKLLKERDLEERQKEFHETSNSPLQEELLAIFSQSQETEKIVLIQSYIRRFLAKKELENLIEARRECERKIVLIQTLFRYHLAARKYKKVQLERDERKKMERNVVIVQKFVRGFLARRRVGERVKKEMTRLDQDAIVERKKQVQCSSSAVSGLLPNPSTTPSTPELLRTLRRLRCEINEVKAHNIAYETALNNLKTLRKCPSLDEQTKSAELIQRVWRGYRTRRDNREGIQKMNEAIEAYKENMNRLELTQDRLQESRPAFQKLYEWTEMLFGTSLYRTKVAAFCINRLIKLSPMLCKHFVIRCQGLAAVLDRMEQMDRSPGEEEIMSSLVAVLCKVVDEAKECSEIQQTLLSFSEDCLKNLFHILNAFYNNANIVRNSSSALVGLKEISPKIQFEKAKYYLLQAEKRFHRFGENDVKKIALRRLTQHYNM